MIHTNRGPRVAPYDARMLKMADRLFDEFEDLPVRTVLRAIASARSRLRDEGHQLPEPDDVGRLARDALTEGPSRLSA